VVVVGGGEFSEFSFYVCALGRAQLQGGIRGTWE